MALWFRAILIFIALKNDIARGASASCNIIFQSAIKIDIALTQVPYLYNICPNEMRDYIIFKIKDFVWCA